MNMNSNRIVPVILSGGSGTRLWPMSTPECPKQFLPLAGEDTMFVQTLDRCADAECFAPPMIVANARHADLIDMQLGGRAASLLLEPCARNTAPAIALAALEAGEAPMLVMPSDQVIADVDAFHRAIALAMPLVEQGWLVTFGITPDKPETGYGYIQVGEALRPGVHQVARFIEKPDRVRAEAMLAQGGHAWNGGIFLFRADAFLSALGAHAPEMLEAVTRAMDQAERAGNRILPDSAAFAGSPSDSIDYAVMEKAGRVAVVPVAMGWTDLGSWDALYEIAKTDAAGNAVKGPVELVSGSGNLVQSDGIAIALSGVDDLIVIAHGNRVMILPRGQSQDVKKFTQ
ncbi:MAG: NTP transferase domain-containing protein [Sphingomonadales bacterium]|nr:NTP transferase domain-containing protein [Sphingomonadales bacterium]